MKSWNLALCYESVLPARGGAETYLGDLSRRLVADGHTVHLYATTWDDTVLPKEMIYHHIPKQHGPRFLRPWKFGRAVLAALSQHQHDVTLGFDKTWGLDLLYPQGGFHRASAWHNLLKYHSPWLRGAASLIKVFDLAHQSYLRIERKQYLGNKPPCIVVNSHMVARHAADYYGLKPPLVQMVRSAIDPARFIATNRQELRQQLRTQYNIPADAPVGLFVGMNYRLKGLGQLIRGLPKLSKDDPTKFIIIGQANYQKYQRLADRLGVTNRCCFAGHQRDPKSYYFAADYLLHPTFYDPCSLVALEAFACGLPVATTIYNGASELIQQHQAGIVIQNPHDAMEVAHAIEKLGNTVNRIAYQQGALTAAAAWTFEDHYRALLQAIAQAHALRNRATE